MTNSKLAHVALVTIATLWMAIAGCGSEASTVGQLDGGQDGTLTDGSGQGDGAANPNCLKIGGACTTSGDCCSGACTGNVCNVPACTSDNTACSSSGQCCSGTCANGKCTPLNTSCKTLGNACTQGSDCCSALCQGGVCSASSYCAQLGDVCSTAADCCGGVCSVTAPATKGTCGQPPAGAANCTAVDGTLCGGVGQDGGVVVTDAGLPSCGGACCSRLCAPYGPTGALICQPASGCHVVGDLCTKDADCCGSAGMPGNNPGKPVTCNITAPNTVGVCRNPIGCKPDGDVCKLKTQSCNASCDCCSGNCETMDTCKVDNVGVPRCAALQCVGSGQACASSANCCNGLPCVPNPNGSSPPFICYSGGGTCVPSCGKCSINADCCAGETCMMGQGSSTGVCGPCSPPSDGGTPPPADAGTGGTCALYGQQCTASSQCCNGVPCANGTILCTGGVGCTCHYPIQ